MTLDRAPDSIVDRHAVTAKTASEIYAAIDILIQQPRLRRFITNPNTEADQRRGVVDELFASQLAPQTLQIIKELAVLQWNSGRAFIDALENAAARIEFKSAAQVREANLDDIRDELFRFSRLVNATPRLRSALTNDAIDLDARRGLVSELLPAGTNPSTVLLARRAVGNRQYEQRIAELLQIASSLRGRGIAKVIVAKPVSQSQIAQIKMQLARIYGIGIDLQLEINPEVLGGVRIEYGDEVIDGTVISKLDQAQRQLGLLED